MMLIANNGRTAGNRHVPTVPVELMLRIEALRLTLRTGIEGDRRGRRTYRAAWEMRERFGDRKVKRHGAAHPDHFLRQLETAIAEIESLKGE